MFSCTLPKVADFQIFLLTRHEFYGNLSQQFNITYLLRVSARLLKEPEQVFNFLSLHNEPEPRPSRKGWSGLGCCVAFFLLPNPAPNLDNRKTVCMGYTAMTPQGRAGKRRRKGAGKPCRENGTLNIKWSKWPPDWGNNTKRHSPETSSTLQLIPCGHFDHMEWTDVAQVNVFKLNTLTPSVLRLTSTWHFAKPRSLCAGLRKP